VSTRFHGNRALSTIPARVALTLLLCASLPVTAAEYCVGTGDELAQAFTDAEATNGTPSFACGPGE
jgi:hypothetical protein